MINKIKNSYSFFILEILSILLLKYSYMILKYAFITELGIAYTLFLILFLGSLVITFIIFVFELIFPIFRIPHKIVNHKLYKIVFAIGFIALIVNIAAIILPLL